MIWLYHIMDSSNRLQHLSVRTDSLLVEILCIRWLQYIPYLRKLLQNYSNWTFRLVLQLSVKVISHPGHSIHGRLKSSASGQVSSISVLQLKSWTEQISLRITSALEQITMLQNCSRSTCALSSVQKHVTMFGNLNDDLIWVLLKLILFLKFLPV